MKYFLAIDIGASSGRHIVGWQENGQILTDEVYRFPNGVKEQDGHLIWDTEALVQHVICGIGKAFAQYPVIESLSIDTWGVDFVLLKDGKEMLPVYAYRDHRTDAVIPKVHELVPFSELYNRTGCQFQPFTTVYQLYDELEQGRLQQADTLLLLPQYLLYRLCGVAALEYTHATTTGLIHAQTGDFDQVLLEKLGYPSKLFPTPLQPGTVLGQLLPELQAQVGGNCNVVLCATHDTGSAVEGIPMEGNHPYISSGTWSLLGVKTPKPITDAASQKANYSNEGGVGYNRYQKNIMGMWLVNELQRELCPDTKFPQIVQMARESTCDVVVDANAPQFLSPKSMKAAFDETTGNALAQIGDYFRCAYRSLALSYKQALEELEANTGCTYDKLYIVGGGAKNTFLNELTQDATGKQIIALPIEATALGNLKIQMEAAQ